MTGLPTIDYWGHGHATGYGVAAMRLARALIDARVRLGWTPIDFHLHRPIFDRSRRTDDVLDRHRDRPRKADVVVLHAIPEMVPAALDARGRAALVCHTVWETEQIQDHWADLLNQCDGVIVPTEWNAEAFRDGGVTVPIGVVPHVRQRDEVEPDVAWLEHLGDRFLVYTIADWSPRKTPWRSIEAFAEAFDAGDDTVAMIVKSGPEIDDPVLTAELPDSVGSHTWAAMARTIGRLGPMHGMSLVTRHLTEREVAGLHARGDCYLALPHAEGWDLGVFDAATSATPVVTTGWGAPLHYLDDDPAQLVPIRLVPTDPSDVSSNPLSHWAEPDLERAVEMLRGVRADQEAARRRATNQAGRLRIAYAPDVVAAVFLEQLDQILTGSVG